MAISDPKPVVYSQDTNQAVGSNMSHWYWQQPYQYPYPSPVSTADYANAIEADWNDHDVTLRFKRVRGASSTLVSELTIPVSAAEALGLKRPKGSK